jgi:type I restriction enzyme S subunit
MKADLQHVTASKNALRRSLAKRPFAEKVRLLEELSERTLATRKDTSLPLPNEPWPIPDHWQWSTMGDVATVVGGGTPRTDRAEYFGGGVPWITPADLSGYHDKTISRGSRNITEEGLANSGARLLPASTVLFSSRAPIGYVAIAANPVATNQGFKSFVLKSHLDSSFVYYYLQRAKPLATALASGTTFLEISGKNAARLPIPVPPIAEQRQIVAEIEKQFTRLEAGVAAMRRVQANLKRYRASVLKAACEGRLVPTEAELARADDRSYEAADQLLARILTERRQKWSGRGKYQEPDGSDTAYPAPLPEGWACTSVEQLGDVQLGRQRSPKNISKNFPTKYIRAANITEHGLDLSDMLEMEFSPDERERYRLSEGDIILSEASGSPSQVGKPAVWHDDLPLCCFQNTVIRLRPVRVQSNYVLIVFQNFYANGLFSKIAGGVGINHLSASKFSRIAFPLPPLAEQKRIVAEVERRLSVVDQLQAVVTANLQRATRLRQSVLMKAFTGQLTQSEMRSG